MTADMRAYDNSTSSWVPVNSPVIQANNETTYQLDVTAPKSFINVTYAIAQYSENKTLLKTSAISNFKISGEPKDINISRSFFLQNENTKYFQIQIWSYVDPDSGNITSLAIESVNVCGTTSNLTFSGIENLFSQSSPEPAVTSIKNVSPTWIVITANTTKPFILVTSQELDGFWVAKINGKVAQPVEVYLGLKGFMIDETGEVSVTLEYEPQSWFNWGLVTSGVTVLLLCVGLIYFHRQRISKKFETN
jgi:hypothetical protein